MFNEVPEQQAFEPVPQSASTFNHALVSYIGLGILAVFAITSLVLLYGLRGRVDTLETRLQTAQDEQAKLTDQLGRTQSQLQASSEMLGEKLGLTQKEIAKRSADILHSQQLAEQRLKDQQQQVQQQEEAKIGAVSENVAGVKTEVGGVKTDVATTKNELEDTRTKLERTIGDLGLQSGLIATTRDELEILKHRGDRNYYEFTLDRTKKRTPVSTVSLELKKADPKHAKYTLEVVADDKTIEKKDRGLNEPVQFYTGRDHLLYELVVNTVEKNKIVGYLSTPKNAPQPLSK